MTSAEFALSLGVRVLNLETYTAVRIDPPGGGVFCIGQSLQAMDLSNRGAFKISLQAVLLAKG